MYKKPATNGQMADVLFQSNLNVTKYLGEIKVSEPIGQLPDLRGYGAIPSLHQALAADDGLLQAVVELFLTVEPLMAKTLVWNIIFAWIGVTDRDPASRGQYVNEARKLYALEKIFGDNFLSRIGSLQLLATPQATDRARLKKAFAEWEQILTSYFMLSTHYNRLYGMVVQVAQVLEAGFTNEEALAPLLNTLRTLYDGGDRSARVEIFDFLQMLMVYDPKGLICSEAILSLCVKKTTGVLDKFEDFIAYAYGLPGNDNSQDLLYGGIGNDILYDEIWAD
ncbi:hypothetical protein FACS189460_3610 [Deltaproteobacteria bacterium]|nr:hypothetical protein FACS189460_3610 [Deltaproteobacteria bacterium]